MSYRFVTAKYFTTGGMTQPRAVVIHMAQGGGTVNWLTHPTNDNSSHFVVEYDGEIVQMVREADASHSLHIARPFGPPGAGDYGYFSLDAAKALLGAGVSDPNRYIFAVEVEGLAADGPNARQMVSLKALADDLRRRHPSIKGLLGHRDFQDEKACPGPHVFDVLRHGAFAPEETDMIPAPITVESAALVSKADGTPWYDLDGKTILEPMPGPLAPRYSPYGVGTLRAIIAGFPDSTHRRTVLIKPSVVSPIAPADVTKLENQVRDLTAVVAASSVQVTALSKENVALKAIRTLAVSAAVAIDKLPRV